MFVNSDAAKSVVKAIVQADGSSLQWLTVGCQLSAGLAMLAEFYMAADRQEEAQELRQALSSGLVWRSAEDASRWFLGMCEMTEEAQRAIQMVAEKRAGNYDEALMMARENAAR